MVFLIDRDLISKSTRKRLDHHGVKVTQLVEMRLRTGKGDMMPKLKEEIVSNTNFMFESQADAYLHASLIK